MLLNAYRLGKEDLILLGIKDITVRKESEKALQKAKDEAEKAAHIREEFLARMSHEIRTPLNAVMGLSHLLLQQDPKKEQLDNLNTLKITSENLGQLISNMLNYSKIKAGKLVVESDTLNLSSLINNIIRIHKTMAAKNNTCLEINIGDKVPEFIISDQLKLSQILHNLLSNAVKFTYGGSVKLQVDLNKQEKQNIWLDFEISDSGIGIPADKLETIFDEFSQAESSTTSQYGGTGLGLTITRMYLKMLGSEIHVESKQDKGSRFYFTIPVKKGKKTKSKPENFVSAEKIRAAVGKICILVVEDDEYNRLIINQLLDSWGVDHDEAIDGQKAVEMAKEKVYDLILMDVRMPVMDGYQSAAEIKKLSVYKNNPIIALTADVSERVKKELENGLFTEVSIKPVDPDKLSSTIVEAVAKKQGGI